MRLPSIERMQSVLSIDLETAKRIRKIMEASNLEKVCELSENARRWVSACYRAPGLSITKMYAIDEVLETHGIEYQGKGSNQKSPAFDYCNAGDTYAPTVLLIWGTNGPRFAVGCWGDIVEKGNYE